MTLSASTAKEIFRVIALVFEDVEALEAQVKVFTAPAATDATTPVAP